jgi:hypothetical protein
MLTNQTREMLFPKQTRYQTALYPGPVAEPDNRFGVGGQAMPEIP